MPPKKNKVKKPLTSKQYLEEGGGKCPNCHSSNITADVVQVDAEAWAEVTCDDCKATWQDVYKLMGYDNLQIPEKEGL